MKKNWLTTAGGIMSGFLLLPETWGTAVQKGIVHGAMPGWMYITCMFIGTLGPVVIGVGAKGQDEHSTLAQVSQSSPNTPIEGKPQ